MLGIDLDKLTHNVFKRIDKIRMDHIYICIGKILVISSCSRSVEVEPEKLPRFAEAALVRMWFKAVDQETSALGKCVGSVVVHQFSLSVKNNN